MLRVAVTGAGGFIGSTTVDLLHSDGWEVSVVLGPQDEKIHFRSDPVRTTACDVTNVDGLSRAFAGVHVIVHAAGPPSVMESLRDPVEFARAHVLGTASVIEAMRRAKVSRIVYLSSAEVYPQVAPELVAEDLAVEALSPYAASKVGAEQLLHAAASCFGLSGYLLRPFSVYGARMARESVLGTIIEQARCGDIIELADLSPVRDYCHVRDAANAIVACCAGFPTGMKTLNISTGVGTTVRDLALAFGVALRRPLEVRESPDGQRPKGLRRSRLVGNNAAARAEIGWRPQYDLSAGLSLTTAELKR